MRGVGLVAAFVSLVFVRPAAAQDDPQTTVSDDAEVASDKPESPSAGWRFGSGTLRQGEEHAWLADTGFSVRAGGFGLAASYRGSLADAFEIEGFGLAPPRAQHHLWLSGRVPVAGGQVGADFGTLLTRGRERHTEQVIGATGVFDVVGTLTIEANAVIDPGDGVDRTNLQGGLQIPIAGSIVSAGPLLSLHDAGSWTAMAGGEVVLGSRMLDVRAGGRFGEATAPVFASTHTAYFATGTLRREVWISAQLHIGPLAMYARYSAQLLELAEEDEGLGEHARVLNVGLGRYLP